MKKEFTRKYTLEGIETNMEERLSFYKELLDAYKNGVLPFGKSVISLDGSGFCYAITKLTYHLKVEGRMSKSIYAYESGTFEQYFPELYKMKPKQGWKEDDRYWFDTSVEGIWQRKDLLKLMIRRFQRRIRYYKTGK